MSRYTWIYLLCPISGFLTFHYLYVTLSYRLGYCLINALIASYLPAYLNRSYLRGGMTIKSVQLSDIWKYGRIYFDAKIEIEEELDSKQSYIFCNFPHGADSINHFMTMTDVCGMLSQIYTGPRVDLAASILFMIPFLREMVMSTGCVDANSATAAYNMKLGKSILIMIGGEKEQLLTQRGKHRIFLKSRKGFIKLALKHGTPLVPMYCFGENDLYLMSGLGQTFRNWLQHSFKIALPIRYNTKDSIEEAEKNSPYKEEHSKAGDRGHWFRQIYKYDPLYICFGITFLANPNVSLRMEFGKPIPVDKIAPNEITSDMIDTLHEVFCKEMQRLFERTKMKHGIKKETVLEIL